MRRREETIYQGAALDGDSAGAPSLPVSFVVAKKKTSHVK
jgi:hypothetical protein